MSDHAQTGDTDFYDRPRPATVILNTSFVVGVDPGLDGGIAAIKLDQTGAASSVDVIPMPTKPGPAGRRDVDGAAVGSFLNGYISYERLWEIKVVAVESVHAMPKQGVSSCFNFGKGYGKILGIIESFEIPLDEPTPQQWQKLVLGGMGAKRGKGERRDKDMSIRFVLNHFPKVNLKATERSTKLHDGMAEAVCIAEYARRTILQAQGGRFAVAGAP